MNGLWDKHVVPRLIGCCCRQPAVMRDRSRIIPKASGDVLELGCGGAANLQYYDWDRVTALSGVDPSPELLERAQAELAKSGRSARFIPGIAEKLPFEDASFDTVVTTFTLCSVQDQRASLSEARRVLRSGGRLLYVEHGQSPDASPARWQRRIEPLWKHIAGGCHLTRPVTQAISTAGFVIGEHRGHYMKRTPKWLGWVEYGEAWMPS
jgi:ubiquinone/menaquinone biosynthesis C-methylase UbiE